MLGMGGWYNTGNRLGLLAIAWLAPAVVVRVQGVSGVAAESYSELSPAVLLALGFFRDPRALREWSARSTALPDGIGELIRLAGARQDILEAVSVDYQADAGELAESVRFFLQQVLLAPGADHYRVLGVEQDADDATIRSRHRLLMRLFHPDRHVGQECWTDAYAARVNQAYNVLRRPQLRASYDQDHPRPVVVGAWSVAASARDEDSRLMREAMAHEGGRWSGGNPQSGGVSIDGGGRGRSMLLAGMVLLLLAFVFAWAMRGDRAMLVSAGGGNLAAADGSRWPGGNTGNQSVRPREAGIPVRHLAALGLQGNDAAAESRSGSVAPQQPLQTAATKPMLVPDLIPRSRRGNSADVERHRTVLVIPPARVVDIPEPKSIPWPAAVTAGNTNQHPAAKSLAGSPQPTAVVSVSASQPTRKQGVVASPRRSSITRRPALVPVAKSARVVREPERAGRVPDARREQQLAVLERGAGTLQARPSQAAKPPVEEPISEKALMSLLGHLASSYQRGDLAAFVGLFADHASTSDEAGRGDIEKEYRKLFLNTQGRSLRVSGVSWQLHAGGAQGDGFMVIQIRRPGRDVEHYQGHFTVHVTRERRHLRISGLYYDLERV